MNLHSIAAGVIAAVNPMQRVKLRQNIGFTTNPDFSRTSTYTITTMNAQIQGMGSDDMRILDGVGISGVRRKCYLWGTWTGIIRGLQKGNDIVIFPDGSEWKIAYVFEEFGHGINGPSGWTSVALTYQNPTSEG